MDPGRRLEKDVLFMCERVGLKATETKASGQVRGDGDVTTGRLMFECKFKSIKGLSVSEGDLIKARAQATRQNKIAVMIARNINNETVASVHIRDFEWMLSALVEAGLIE